VGLRTEGVSGLGADPPPPPAGVPDEPGPVARAGSEAPFAIVTPAAAGPGRAAEEEGS
jgi:hypothetical protein